MTIVPLKLIPGVDVEKTIALNQAGISRSALIRFEEGLAQKLGGWTKYYPVALSGIPRDMHAWESLNNVGLLSIGTTTELAIIADGDLSNITPQELLSDFAPDFTTILNDPQVEVDDPNIANVTTLDVVYFNTPISVGGIILFGAYPIDIVTGATTYKITALTPATAAITSGGAVPSFTTTLNSSEVTVGLAAHGLAVGQFFTFPITTTGGGVTISGTYTVTSVPTADTFVIVADVEASSAATFFMNASEAELLYYINLGPSAAGIGYGLGGYGDGGYGTGVVPASQTGTPITATDWSTDNWGEDLMANPRGGGIYVWGPRSGFLNAALIATAPVFNNGLFVAMPQQILVAWGSTTSIAGLPLGLNGNLDPLLIRWSDIEDFTTWLPASGNQAGSFRISNGSSIKGALQASTQALIWTDLGIWSMQYVNQPLIFGFRNIGNGCGLVGAHAAGVLQQTVYWMSSYNFFALGSGGVQEIPCPVWDAVFQDLDTANIEKCRAWPNSTFGEMWWFYPSASGGTGECDSYVKYSVSESAKLGTAVWDYGPLPRSAAIDQSVLGQPIAASPQGVIYLHETTMDADGQPLLASYETGWFAISEGWDLTFIDQFWPDFRFKFWNSTGGSANVQMLITTADYPNGPQTVNGPYSITDAATFIGTRARGRLAKIAVSSADVGTWWRTGLSRYRAAKAGRR